MSKVCSIKQYPDLFLYSFYFSYSFALILSAHRSLTCLACFQTSLAIHHHSLSFTLSTREFSVATFVVFARSTEANRIVMRICDLFLLF